MEYYYLISGDYMGEKLSDDYSENFEKESNLDQSDYFTKNPKDNQK